MSTNRKEIGAQRRKIGDEEIVQRLIFALVNEGRRSCRRVFTACFRHDMVYLTGTVSPFTGGADALTPTRWDCTKVVDSMKRFAANPHGDPVSGTRASAGELASEAKVSTRPDDPQCHWLFHLCARTFSLPCHHDFVWMKGAEFLGRPRPCQGALLGELLFTSACARPWSPRR